MSDHEGPHLDAVEQRLAARTRRVAPAGHRDRVLAAVRDTLTGRIVSAAHPAGLDDVGTAALAALALAALLAVVAPWLVIAQAVVPLPPESRIVTQARAAGIEFPMELVAATGTPGDAPLSRPSGQSPVRIPEAWRLRNLLTGEL